jgi:hypothetical protein
MGMNSFVDRDMLMRFHWGYGVGHAYCHEDAPDSVPATSKLTTQHVLAAGTSGPPELDRRPERPIAPSDTRNEQTDSEDSELGLSDREQRDLEDVED